MPSILIVEDEVILAKDLSNSLVSLGYDIVGRTATAKEAIRIIRNNLRRIERYLALVYNCDLKPVIILTKADLQQNPEHFVAEVETIAFGVPIHSVSIMDSKGLALLEDYLSLGQATVMVGSSGAGKRAPTAWRRNAGKMCR